VGLFGYSKNYNTIKNLNIKNASITGHDYCGIVAGYLYITTIRNCSASGSCSGNENVGGIVGKGDRSYIYYTKNEANVTATGDYCGGIIGYISGSYTYSRIENSSNTGNVEGENYVGGIFGEGYVAIFEVTYSKGQIKGSNYVGGFGGKGTDTQIYNCYTIGDVVRKSSSGYVSLSLFVAYLYGTATDKAKIWNHLVLASGGNLYYYRKGGHQGKAGN